MTLHRLLIAGEDWQPVAQALAFADGPTTDAEGNFYFSDMRGDAAGIYRVTDDGKKTKLSDEGVSGLKFAPDGRLIAAQRRKDAEFVECRKFRTGKPPTPLSRLFPSLALCVNKAFRAVKFLCPSVFSRDAPVDSRGLAGKNPSQSSCPGVFEESVEIRGEISTCAEI